MKALSTGKLARLAGVPDYVAKEWLGKNAEPIDAIKYARGVSLIYANKVKRRIPELRAYAAERNAVIVARGGATVPAPAPAAANDSDIVARLARIERAVTQLAAKAA